MFQSHNGAIAAFIVNGFKANFCHVSIPQWCDCCEGELVKLLSRYPRFNPTMVRLLLVS